MDTEAGEYTPPEAQKMTTEKQEKPTFEELAEQAWEYASPDIKFWQETLSNCAETHSSQLNSYFSDLESLYAIDGSPQMFPRVVTTDLHYYPSRNSTKGEPASYLKHKGRATQDMGDVLYWVSNPPENPDQVDQRAEGIILKITHETQHENMQGKRFHDLVHDVEQIPEIAQTINRLKTENPGYFNISNELITSYLEQYGREKLSEDAKNTIEGGQVALRFRADKKHFASLLENIIRDDIEDPKWEDGGPYRTLRQGWEKMFGMPEGYETKNIKQSEEALGEEPPTRSIYDRAYTLDTSKEQSPNS